MVTITGWPGTAGNFEGPTLFLSGGNSEYVRREHRDLVRSQFPKARFASIPGAGHWLHAEKPREFEVAARSFLDA
jgi:esterase